MRLSKPCPFCGKKFDLLCKEILSNGETLKFYRCGHFFIDNQAKLAFEPLELNSLNGQKNRYDYQAEGVEFILENNCTGLIADQMGLGKTVQALLAIRNAKHFPVLIVVRGATLWQWMQEYKEWTDSTPLGIFMIRSSKDFIPPGFKAYVISMDTFSRMVEVESKLTTSKSYYDYKAQDEITGIKVQKHLAALNIKTIIVDECQSFKDQSAKRSKALVAFVKDQNVEHKIFLSGTPIKNRADEYFTTLNLLDPESFASIERFRREWLVQDGKGKWSRVNPYREEQFREKISDYVIRREVKDVMKDLPPFRRTFETIHIEDEKWKDIYNRELTELAAKDASKANLTWMDVQDNLMRLRRICGMAKVDFAVDYVDIFLETTENEKIAIGIHHEAVRDALFVKLSERGFNPLKLSGEDNSDKKEAIKQEFKKDGRRVLIINMLAGGVGMDGLQVCNNILCLERQWNSVDEEQFEARFHRNGQTRPVIAEYMIAKDTIDDYFSALVEEKREIFGRTVGNDWNLASDSNMIADLVGRTIAKKL